MQNKLEICCYTVESAIKAQNAGADRIELCDNFSEGGTSPSYAAIHYCVNKLRIPTNVIIRPRGGDFLYSDIEFELIKKDVLECKNIGANGIVIGLLTANGDIDIDKTKAIMEIAKPMEVTFHRAFDMCNNHQKALSEIIDLGIDRILTSGAKNKAIDGINLITELINKANNRIIIMPGSGINENNLKQIMKQTNAKEFHSSAKVFINSKMKNFNSEISMGGVGNIDEYASISVDSSSIIKMKNILK